MNPSTVSAATGTSNCQNECPAPPGTTQKGPDAVLAALLDEYDHGPNDREAHDVLLGCLRDLSGYPATALPELVFRLMCQRIGVRSEIHHAGPSTRYVA